MYKEIDKEGHTRDIDSAMMLKLLNFFYPYTAIQVEQEMRLEGRKVCVGGANPAHFKTYHYIKEAFNDTK